MTGTVASGRTGALAPVPEWARACAADDELAAMAVEARVAFAIRTAEPAEGVLFTFADGRFADARPLAGPGAGDGVEFEVVAPASAWAEFLAALPRPTFHSVFAMLMRVDGTEVRGSELRFAQYCHLVRRVLELGRQVRSGVAQTRVPATDPFGTDPASIRSGYRTLPVAGRPNRVFYEEAGAGRDMIMLHTAGADARQFHHLLADERLRSRFRMVAPDLPWHGRSFPPPGAAIGSYALTTDDYVESVVGLAGALALTRPIVVGSSMAGLIGLELAYRRPDLFGGVVACEASDVVPGRQVRWARHPEVDQAVFVPEWIDGLMAPHTPPEHRQEIWWTYSQGGFGTFFGDIRFYSGDFDARDRVARIDTARCPVVMMTGEYDYSCTPQMSRRTADRIPGAVFRELPGLGHFPHAENPAMFAGHLLDAVDVIESTEAGA